MQTTFYSSVYLKYVCYIKQYMCLIVYPLCMNLLNSIHKYSKNVTANILECVAFRYASKHCDLGFILGICCLNINQLQIVSSCCTFGVKTQQLLYITYVNYLTKGSCKHDALNKRNNNNEEYNIEDKYILYVDNVH